MKKIIELYKKEGETPLESIKKFKKENLAYEKIKMTYAGRLDPMAEGVLLILAGDECKNKNKYLEFSKEYEFEILWNFQTDTYDILGFPKYKTKKEPSILEINDKIKKMVGKTNQKYPPYSSKTVSGKPLFKFAREKKLKTITIPTKEIEIYKIKFLKNHCIASKKLFKNILQRINRVRGDFRQKQIIKKWEFILKNKQFENKKFVISKFKINCSSGTYVRGIAHKLGGLAFKIKRTKITAKNPSETAKKITEN